MLDGGEKIFDGPVGEGMPFYHRLMGTPTDAGGRRHEARGGARRRARRGRRARRRAAAGDGDRADRARLDRAAHGVGDDRARHRPHGSTRKLGAPITWAKRQLIHVLRQYLRELQSQQTRFNLNVLIRVAELEDRVARLEERAPARRRAAGASRERPPGPQRRRSRTTPSRRRRSPSASCFGALGLGRARRRGGDRPAHRRRGSRRCARSTRATATCCSIHYSAYAPKLRAVLELPNRKLLHLAQHHAGALVLGPRPAGRRRLRARAASSCRSSPRPPTSPPACRSTTRASWAPTIVIPILFDPRELGAAGATGRAAGRARRRSSSSGASRRTSARTRSSARSSSTAAATRPTRGSCSSARRSTGPTTRRCASSPRSSRRARSRSSRA